MPRKSKQQIAAEQAEAARLARPFAVDSTDPYGARTAEQQAEVAASIAAAKLAGASGNELRGQFGERLTGPARRKVLRAHGYDGTAYVARSYSQYRDGEDRSGTRHAREHGAQAEARRAEARAEAEQALADARKARKGRSKAEREAYAANVAQAEQRLAALA